MGADKNGSPLASHPAIFGGIDRTINTDSSDAYDSANLGWNHKGQMVHSLLE